MVGLLKHDRTRGPEFASILRGVVSQQRAVALHELVTNFARSAEDAAALRDMFWHEIPDTLTQVQAIVEYADRSDALVFALPDEDGMAAGLRAMGRNVHECLWGWVMVEDSPTKRIQAKMKVISLRSRDLKCLEIMEIMAEDIKSMGERKWPPRKWRPKRLKEK